ncbi:Uncharacterized membrane protein YsdA, DUF1294 family [Natronincola peptidivorans]|uniref:Uncharacterized membrane protein YsdA, DUF1294 family n=1 Tax=Natronincola peptidivorans TaxID=426128 RepID=A0A1I0GTP4_9FIRM|nr:DUF1294 domain-containing protein [Natronincola peptidivorans]SET74517.1 Uncharacterized membrane protein YsdA, DUF1294 family [Natronincola peptidivorans]
MDLFMDIIKGYSSSIIIYSIYLFIVNIAAFLLVGIDKRRAKREEWRIKEMTFIMMALLGAAAGVLLGMVFFHHKQSKKKFYFGVPILYIINKIASIIIYHHLLR